MIPAVEAMGGEIVECAVIVDRSGGLRHADVAGDRPRLPAARRCGALELPTYEPGAGHLPALRGRRARGQAREQRHGDGAGVSHVAARWPSWRGTLGLAGRGRIPARAPRPSASSRPPCPGDLAVTGASSRSTPRAHEGRVHLRTDAGESLQIGVAGERRRVPPGHLAEHMATSSPVRVLPRRGGTPWSTASRTRGSREPCRRRPCRCCGPGDRRERGPRLVVAGHALEGARTIPLRSTAKIHGSVRMPHSFTTRPAGAGRSRRAPAGAALGERELYGSTLMNATDAGAVAAPA